MFPSCCSLPVRSIPPHPSPGTLPSSSWPFAIARAGGVHQGRFSPQRPLAPKVGVRPEVGLIRKEYFGSSTSRLVPPDGILRHEGLTLSRIRLDQPLLGLLQDKPQTVQIIQVRRRRTAAEADYQTVPRQTACTDLPIPVGQLRCPMLTGGCGTAAFQLRLLRLVKAGGEPPVGSNIKAAAGPPSPKADGPSPYRVRDPAASASAVAAAVQARSQQPALRTTFPVPGAWAPSIIRRRRSLESHLPPFQQTGPYL